MDLENLKSFLRLQIAHGTASFESSAKAFDLVANKGWQIVGWPADYGVFILEKVASVPIYEGKAWSFAYSRAGTAIRRQEVLIRATPSHLS